MRRIRLSDFERERDRRARNGEFVCCADLRSAANELGLIDPIAEALRFPPWGRNWDALSDFAGDLEWISERGVVLGLRGLEAAFERLPSEAALLVRILSEESQFHASYGRSFEVLSILEE
ncbi:MAG TPA: barstar family protein [Fimbriimonadaceae bacterium]|nr:barstar family protein [Fimbriimonadaceae bacterium]